MDSDPFGFLYQGVMSLRNWSYDSGICLSHKLSVPVVSVGNLTAGGTGKTPIVADLVAWSQKLKIPVGVISRGYKGCYKGVQRVSSDVHAIPIWGDEPTMLARRFPDVPVFVHPDRVLAGETLLAQTPVRWILADDAFQHRRLYRQMDIVVCDLSAPLWHLNSLPKGRARERLSSLERANFVVLNKRNLGSEENYVGWRQAIEKWVSADRMIEVNYCLLATRSVAEGIPLEKGEAVWLVSGIGNPSSFESLVKQAGYSMRGHSIFKDHHVYSQPDVQNILSDLKKAQVNKVLTTSKDLIKLIGHSDLTGFLFEARLGLLWGDGRDKLDAEILCLVS